MMNYLRCRSDVPLCSMILELAMNSHSHISIPSLPSPIPIVLGFLSKAVSVLWLLVWHSSELLKHTGRVHSNGMFSKTSFTPPYLHPPSIHVECNQPAGAFYSNMGDQVTHHWFPQEQLNWTESLSRESTILIQSNNPRHFLSNSVNCSSQHSSCLLSVCSLKKSSVHTHPWHWKREKNTMSWTKL